MKALLSFLVITGSMHAAPLTLDVWPEIPPGETREWPPEADTTPTDGKLVAGRPVIRLGNVSRPQITVYPPSKEKDTGASVLICPGGGFNILAYDLEGTEIAEWFNSIGVTGIVLKYRVPFRDPNRRWFAAVQDAQRAMSLVRSKAAEWQLDPNRIGMCGFSAGGAMTGFTSTLLDQRLYPPVDAVDQVSSRPDFAMLIYPGGFDDQAKGQVRGESLKVTKGVPPMFMVHAFDDRVTPLNSLNLALELKQAEVPVELHLYDAGGHGYGLLQVAEFPVTTWPQRAEEWLARNGILKPGE